MKGKFNSLRDQVVYRASLDPWSETETMGDDMGGLTVTRLDDFYGLDYLVLEYSSGRVEVEAYEDIAIAGGVFRIDGLLIGGYYSPAGKRWSELRTLIYGDETETDEEEDWSDDETDENVCNGDCAGACTDQMYQTRLVHNFENGRDADGEVLS